MLLIMTTLSAIIGCILSSLMQLIDMTFRQLHQILLAYATDAILRVARRMGYRAEQPAAAAPPRPLQRRYPLRQRNQPQRLTYY